MNKSTPYFWTIFAYLGIGLLLLLLVGNVALLLCGVSVNKSICMEAARAGADACAKGGNQKDIEAAVFRTINGSSINVFFLDRPELTEIKFYIRDEKGTRQQMLLVKTITGVRVPAPFLLFITQPEPSGFIHFSSSCAIKLKDYHVSLKRTADKSTTAFKSQIFAY